MIIFVLCCLTLNGCGIARRVITAPIRVFTENTNNPATEDTTALAFKDTTEDGGESYVITYDSQ